MADPFDSAVARAFAALEPPDRVLVAVSGGADSVALLHALARAVRRRALTRVKLVVGHIDHRLRPDSAVDAENVRRHAEALSLPFALATLDFPDRRNLEEKAREARYAALLELAVAHGAQAIATAHTATDQAETLLWRLARGSSTRGLAAIPPRRKLGPVLLLRPMLGVSREEARERCARGALVFRDDPTNLDERPRARLRAEVLPVLERLAPGAAHHLAEAAARLREDEAWLAREAGVPEPAASVSQLAGLPSALRRRALAAWVERVCGTRRRLTARHLVALEHLVVTSHGEVELPSSRLTRRVAVVRAGLLTLDERGRDGSVRGHDG